MRGTFDEYRRELDGMGFSPGEKNELVGRLSRTAAPHRARFPRAAVVAGVPLDYESTATTLPVGQTVDYEGATVTVTELSVSPLGVMISYDLAGTPDTGQEFPQLNLPVFVNFADGTSFDATWVGGFGDDTHVNKGASFDRIVDVKDIVSVTVGDVTIEVPHA